MASTAMQNPTSTDQPPRFSRYRSTRKPHAHPAIANASSPPLPASLVDPSSAIPAPPQELAQQNNSLTNQDPAQPDEINQAVQRSKSRYRKPHKPNATVSVSPTPAVPKLVQPQHVPPESTEWTATEAQNQAPQDQHGVRRIVSDRALRTTRERGIPAFTPAIEHPVSPAMVSGAVPQDTNNPDPLQLTASRSRYRRAAPVKQISASNLASTARAFDPQHTLPPNLKQEHRDTIRKVQRQASFPNSTPSQQPPLPRSLTKASLDQIPDANKEDRENYFNQMKAITLQSALGSQRNLELPRAPKAHASRAQNEVKKMMDAETERQRRMQQKIKMQREKAKAEEEEQAKARRMEEESRIVEKRRREEKEREDKARAEADAKERKEAAKAERKKPTAKRHQRKESEDERAQRHRNRSLSALEGSESTKKTSPEVIPNPPLAANAKEPLGFLKRQPAENGSSSNGRVKSDKQRQQTSNEETNIRPGGGGVVHGVDAPISAVNAGDRRVTVECNQSSIYLPVTTTTTPVDLIRSAATCLAETIDTSASVLLESFGKVGVQRPLRNYEHIRDVMNSWDDDRQNSLVLVPSATGGADVDLQSSSVFAEQPDEVSFQLHYSQRPGKWEKKWITLRSDGQIVSAKSLGHKDTTNVCHMSDFDIYTPNQQQLTKKIKPPKKLCFAIKSQQKSSMFLSSENFVHFFSTGDKQTAADWYKAVQGWRSWYLVNIMGEGTKPQARKDDRNGAPLLPEISGTQKPGSRDSHYQLGSFKPLLDFDMLAFTSEESGGDKLGALGGTLHSHNKLSKSSGAPPSSYPRNMVGDADTAHFRNPSTSLTQGSSDDDMFASTGLLGRSYSTRQKAQRDRDFGLSLEGPFTGGLLESQMRPSMDQSRPNMSDLTRSTSNARRPKPLVDLTPGYQDPPQHARKGRGFVPEQVGAGGLINAATSPETAISVPPLNDWRARPGARGDGGDGLTRANSSGIGRNRSIRRANERDNEQNTSPFAADGLISTGPAGQGQITTGRGVMDGSRVRMSQGMGPMLDMNLQSNFVEGSLLRKVEAEQGPQQPVIDRGRGEEVKVGTGEGL